VDDTFLPTKTFHHDYQSYITPNIIKTERELYPLIN